MLKKRKTGKTKPQAGRNERKLIALGRKWEKVLKARVTDAVAHMHLAQELYDLAITNEDAELRIVERRLDKPKAKPSTTRYKLTDPRAALHTMLRFCNVWIPMGQWICLLRGCPPWNPPVRLRASTAFSLAAASTPAPHRVPQKHAACIFVYERA